MQKIRVYFVDGPLLFVRYLRLTIYFFYKILGNEINKFLNYKFFLGVLLYGPPGTGKTLLARACAAQTKSTFLKLAGPQLVQMFIGDGAKLVRDAFALAKEKSPAIIFIDELDAIGTKRFDSEKAGDREVQRTMLELLNQLDGFSSTADIKVIAATNRVDILDPALLRSGKLHFIVLIIVYLDFILA